ncbi:uncharacterized protein LOC6736717 [Drosophila simulans]|uniref:Uncharacterized protein n=2 Tax=Drosophila simulans TaxID=7240 RepID=A0A0J9RP53_DROSI|nr:uncharacterized protein LOC6736717 [Drosophila simulans]KMY97487.1 uncharacterized protein Dsimw501_GD13810 [Drosophila simulans]
MGERVEKRQGKMGGCGLQLVLPLVTILILAAQAQAMTSSPVLKDDTLGDAAALAAAHSAAKILEDVQTISAVQDWSLLCKELCGAGLGVASTPDVAKNTILRPETDVAKCRQLCGLPRGEAGDLVCSSFCGQKGRSLPGCSPCQQEVRRMREMKETKERKEKEEKQEVRKNEEKASGVMGDPTHGSRAAENAERRGSVEEATVSAAPVAAASDTDTTTPAPDWDEVCKVLCKTGDGGSLCNCDLSPFFS